MYQYICVVTMTNMMALFQCLFVVLIIRYVSTELSHSDEHEPAFHRILETIMLSGTELQLMDVNKVLKMLGIHDCSNVTQHKCVTAESLFSIFNISNTTSVNEDTFSKFAPIIVYALLPNDDHDDHDHHKDDNEHDKDGEHTDDDHKHDHKDDDDHDNHENDGDHDDGEKQITENIDVYQKIVNRYETGDICEQILDQLLKDVNQTTGQLLHAKEKCFSSYVIFHELNISRNSVIGKSVLQNVSVGIISRLIKKECIRVRYQSPLPCSSYFANQLFEEYAKNGTISKTEIEELIKKLKIGGLSKENSDSSDGHDDHDDHDDHSHRRRRSLDSSKIQEKQLVLRRRFRREADEHDHNQEATKYQKCYTVDEFFDIHQVNKTVGFTLEEFQRLTSALVQQIESGICAADGEHSQHSSDDVADKHKWGYGVLAVAIISLCSVVGVAIIPFMNKIFYHKAIVFFISLAVGTLLGDALLHLFPHALGFHASHDHDHGSESSHEDEDRDYLWKLLLASAGIYAFFLFETLTHLFLRKRIGHSHSVEHTRKHSQFGENEYNTAELGVVTGQQPAVLTNKAYMNDEESEKGRYYNDATTANVGKANVFQNGSGESPTQSSAIKEKKEVKKTISSVAWNIIIGDTIHNIADGIAIGAAFSDSISGGISTTIAVFCHELPHELGDFAVLLSAGLSVKKALLANFLSACSCFIGLVIGILITENENANLWIFAITGGFFIYIALTNMLPELMHSADFDVVPKLSRFLLQNLGILTGFGIMFLLSYFEEDINV